MYVLLFGMIPFSWIYNSYLWGFASVKTELKFIHSAFTPVVILHLYSFMVSVISLSFLMTCYFSILSILKQFPSLIFLFIMLLNAFILWYSQYWKLRRWIKYLNPERPRMMLPNLFLSDSSIILYLLSIFFLGYSGSKSQWLMKLSLPWVPQLPL